MDLPLKKEYLIFELNKATTKDGRLYLRMILSDEGTLMNAIMFDCAKLDFEPKKGDIIHISAVLQQYNEKPQLKINDMAFVARGGSEAFLPKSKNNPKAMADELVQLFEKHVKDERLAALAANFFNDVALWEKFQIMPAAKSVHHAYLHGLLEHTLAVVRLVVKIAPLYPHINKDLVMLGALFHDIGKVVELDMSSGFDYTDEGRLLGHPVIGYDMVSDYIHKIENFPIPLKQQLLHMIASHHGLLEYGALQVPKTSEALLLHFIDDMDSKLNAFTSVLARGSVNPGEWSEYDRILERQIYLPKPEDIA